MTSPHRRLAATTLTLVALGATAACGGSDFDKGSSTAKQASGPAQLKVLIASSGDAETKAVTTAASAWASKSGNTVTVTAATDMAQQLSQGFSSGNPPDVFYVDAARFADYASVGALSPYADQVKDKEDFYPNLRQSFTYQNKLYCVPKDFSTLALEINSADWTKAGLTNADVPTSWQQLATVAKKLPTKDRVGLAIGDTRDRVGAFMVEAGGWVLDKNGKTATADTPANVAALTYVRSLLTSGVAKYPKQLNSGWAGEAFGKGKAAMTIEGNWIKGAMKNDFPTVKYTVAPLPAGPKGKGTLSFTQCWGIAAKSSHQPQAQSLVQALSTKEQQLAFADAFGVMPSRLSARAAYAAKFPQDTAFLEGADYGQGPVNAPKFDQVLADFDTGIQQLARKNPQQVLARLQKNATAALGG